MQTNKEGKMSLDNTPLILFRYQKGGPNGDEEALDVGALIPGIKYLNRKIYPGMLQIIASPEKIRIIDRIPIK